MKVQHATYILMEGHAYWSERTIKTELDGGDLRWVGGIAKGFQMAAEKLVQYENRMKLRAGDSSASTPRHPNEFILSLISNGSGCEIGGKAESSGSQSHSQDDNRESKERSNKVFDRLGNSINGISS